MCLFTENSWRPRVTPCGPCCACNSRSKVANRVCLLCCLLWRFDCGPCYGCCVPPPGACAHSTSTVWAPTSATYQQYGHYKEDHSTSEGHNGMNQVWEAEAVCTAHSTHSSTCGFPDDCVRDAMRAYACCCCCFQRWHPIRDWYASYTWCGASCSCVDTSTCSADPPDLCMCICLNSHNAAVLSPQSRGTDVLPHQA